MIFDYINLALRNVRKRGIRSWLTMIGIFIGIAAVVSLISLGNGLQTAITGQFSQLGTDKLMITSAETNFGPPGANAVTPLTTHDLNLIKRISGVENAVPRLLRVLKTQYNNIAEYDYVASLPEKQEDIKLVYETIDVGTESGRLLTADDSGKILLGHDFTKNKFDKLIRVGSSINIQGRNFQVAGILKETGTFEINSAIIMPENDLKSITNISDQIDLIAVKVVNSDLTAKVASNIEDAMRKDRNEKKGQEDFSVQTPQQALQTVNTILLIINLVVVGIAAISLIVGGIGITNTMYTAVLERTKEIGVMKAVGAKNEDILTLFLIESSLLGFIGGVIGAVIGLGFAYTVAFGVNSAFPGLNFHVAFSYPLVIGSILFALVVGAVSGMVPAYQASRMKPVEALRAW